MAKTSSLPVTGLRSRGPLKDTKDYKLSLNESKLFPWSSRISLVPLRTFRGHLFSKPVTGQELFLVVFYSKQTLASENICHPVSAWCTSGVWCACLGLHAGARALGKKLHIPFVLWQFVGPFVGHFLGWLVGQFFVESCFLYGHTKIEKNMSWNHRA